MKQIRRIEKLLRTSLSAGRLGGEQKNSDFCLPIDSFFFLSEKMGMCSKGANKLSKDLLSTAKLKVSHVHKLVALC